MREIILAVIDLEPVEQVNLNLAKRFPQRDFANEFASHRAHRVGFVPMPTIGVNRPNGQSQVIVGAKLRAIRRSVVCHLERLAPGWLLQIDGNDRFARRRWTTENAAFKQKSQDAPDIARRNLHESP
ncbi:MAG: hypothetical protein IIC02_11720 [Planctomycetes bacterium]|nr:hypothetical protein [Planctomycetota bacterium]MCH9003232.1 hypothetical protein [Planctomycetota bacterium]